MSSFLKKSRRVEMGVRVLVDSCRASLQSAECVLRHSSSCGTHSEKEQPAPDLELEDLWSSMPFLDNSMTSNLIWDVSKAAFHQSFTVFYELTRRRTRFKGWDPEINDGAFQTFGSHKLIESRVVDVQEGPIAYSIHIIQYSGLKESDVETTTYSPPSTKAPHLLQSWDFLVLDCK